MPEPLSEVEFETRTVGPLVLTTPFLRNLGLAEIVDRVCPVGEQADMGYGMVAEMVVQCRLTEPRAMYDMVDWAQKYDLTALYEELEGAEQLNDDRVGRMLEAIYDKRAVIWGEMIGRASRVYEIEMRRLHADTAPIKFAGLFADQPEKEEGVARLEPGYNPQGEWVQQLKLFALATGDGGLPVWFDALSGGEGDSPNYVPQFEAFSQHAQLATMLPLEEVIVLGDRKMPTEDNQLAWLRLGVGYIGPTTMQAHHQQTLRELLKQNEWTELPYVAKRDANKKKEERTMYQGVGHPVTLTDPENDDKYLVRHLYIRSSALAQREAKRRDDQMKAIETEIQRIQGLVNKYDYKTAEIIVQRVQKKAFKKRSAQHYFEIKVVEHPDRPQAPLELLYTVNQQQIAQDTELDGIYLLVAGGPATADLDDAALLQEWKGQYKVEHCFRLTNQIFLVGPLFLKNPRRIVSLIFLIMVGSLVAGLLERQIHRMLAQRQEPIHGLMPEGRDHLKPTISRILQAFAHYSIVHIRLPDGSLAGRYFAKLDAVQQQILAVLGWPTPAELFARPAME